LISSIPVPQYKNIDICGALVVVCIIIIKDGSTVGGTVNILTGDDEGDLVAGSDDGASVTKSGDGASVTGTEFGAVVTSGENEELVTDDDDGGFVDNSSDPSSVSHGVFGKHAKPSGHSELLPLGHGFRQLVEAS
jgi:hypothetical protein